MCVYLTSFQFYSVSFYSITNLEHILISIETDLTCRISCTAIFRAKIIRIVRLGTRKLRNSKFHHRTGLPSNRTLWELSLRTRIGDSKGRCLAAACCLSTGNCRPERRRRCTKCGQGLRHLEKSAAKKTLHSPQNQPRLLNKIIAAFYLFLNLTFYCILEALHFSWRFQL
jgi:hypothetical protein